MDPLVRTKTSIPPPDQPPYKPSQSRRGTGQQLPQIAEVRPPTPTITDMVASTLTMSLQTADLVNRNGSPEQDSTDRAEVEMEISEVKCKNVDLTGRMDDEVDKLLRGKSTELKPRTRTLHVHTIACPLGK